MLIVCFKLDKDGASKTIPSAYPNALAYVNPTWQKDVTVLRVKTVNLCTN